MAVLSPLGSIKLKTFVGKQDFDLRRFGRDFTLNSLLVLYDSGEGIDGILTDQLLAANDEFDTGWINTGNIKAKVYVSVKTDKNVKVLFEESVDGANVAARKGVDVSANTAADADIIISNFDITLPYFRIRIKNVDTIAQTEHLTVVSIAPV